MFDAVVVGSGPNGLAAAITLAREGRLVRVYETADQIGGGLRSGELSTPGVTHDLCATIHSMALASPFFAALPLAERGVEFVHADATFAHPLDDGSAVVSTRSLDQTADALGAADGKKYRKLIAPFVDRADDLMLALLGPLGVRQPVLFARFGRQAIRSAEGFAKAAFDDERTRAMFAGVAAHGIVPIDRVSTAGYGLALIVAAHAYGWPVVRGGSQRLADVLANYFRSIGGEIMSNRRIETLDELPKSRAVLCDVSPRQFIRMAGASLPAVYRRRLERYRYGPGVFKMDWVLSSPVPWRAPACASACTLHLGGSLREISHAEREVWEGRHVERPYMIVVQATTVDATRAPSGLHTLWAYCHVPNGSTFDMSGRMEDQIERAAPGFRDCIVARTVTTPADLETRNPNLVGGDIAGGATDLAQLFTRPIVSLDPYATPIPGVYLCSSSTPPGIGVHGMCGYYAAQSAIKKTLNRSR